MKKIYIICPVRNATMYQLHMMDEYVADLRAAGNNVHYPPDSVPQNDPTGQTINHLHRIAMEDCDEVHVFWDADSFGSHFDLGMAFALHKEIVPIYKFREDPVGKKTYWKSILVPHPLSRLIV